MSRVNKADDTARILLWALMALFLVMAVLGVLLFFTMEWTGFGMMGMGFGALGLLMAVPAFVLVLFLLVVLGAFDRTYGTRSSAMEVLQLRLARGEISPEEYASLRGELRR